MSGCLFVLGLLFYLIGLIQLISPGRQPSSSPRPARLMDRPSLSNPPVKINAQPNPTAGLVNSPSASPMKTTNPLAWIQIGERIQVNHPAAGTLTVHVFGGVRFAELWQTSRGPQSPWVETGNIYLGFWLDTNRLLLNWQNRFYILDEAVIISDNEIQRDFAPHARKFAQSDQTADVFFEYPPAVWHIDDIGKFRVIEVSGQGFNLQKGASGRFLHASGDGQRALVLFDYEGGVGQDTVWIGYKIQEEDIQKT